MSPLLRIKSKLEAHAIAHLVTNFNKDKDIKKVETTKKSPKHKY